LLIKIATFVTKNEKERVFNGRELGKRTKLFLMI